ncbi:MAG: alpha/beta fold hydrolase [Bacteroidales bacterium]|nr:alpha/beta fold hydrolase [Bacteroidales bacterium]
MKRIVLLVLATLACTLVISACAGSKKSTPIDHTQSYAFHTDTVYCQRDGLNIFGVAYIPEGQDQKWPLVIYAHGIGSSHTAGEPYAEAFAKKGYVAYTFDFCGSSPRSKSDGNTDDMTIFTEQKDLTAIIANLKQLPYVDADRTYLLGISLGGLVSSITAASMPEQIRNLALVYPALCAPDDARKSYDENGNRLDPNARIMGGEDYNKAMLKFDPFEHIGAYTKPVFIVHGTEDRLVPIAYSERAVTVFPDARLEKIEGAGHGFRGEPLEKAIKLIGDQLDQWELE